MVTETDVLLTIKSRDIDVKKYEEYLEGILRQLLNTLDMNFDVLIGKPQRVDRLNSHC